MAHIFDSDIPTDIYKYRPLDGDDSRHWLRQTLVDDLAYFSTPNQFNDPFDCAPVFQGLKGAELERHVRTLIKRMNPESNRAERRQEESELRRTRSRTHDERLRSVLAFNQETAVYSLSAEPADLLMWSHYASSHRGVCLHFDMLALLDHFVVRGMSGLPVSYSNQRPVIVIGANEEPRELQRKAFLVKPKCWQYEQEWRFLDYHGGSGLRRFPATALRSVILGSSINDEDAALIHSLVEERRVPVPVRRASLDATAYHMKIS